MQVYLWKKQATIIYFTASTIILRHKPQEQQVLIRVIVILEETNIRSSQSFLSAIVLPEQVRFQPFLEGGETVSVPDGGGELIPPLGSQTGEELVQYQEVRQVGGNVIIT